MKDYVLGKFSKDDKEVKINTNDMEFNNYIFELIFDILDGIFD